MNHPVGQTLNGIPVHVDLIRSHAAKRIAQQPYLLQLLKDVLQKRSPRGSVVTIEHDMGRVIGYDPIVATTEKDIIFYAQLVNEDAFTRFVKNGDAQTTQYLTVILHSTEGESAYELYDIWIGRITPPQLGSEEGTAESQAYWADHAFLFDNQPLKIRTITKVSPY